MKKLTYILIAVITAAFITSCEKDDVKTMISENPVAPELTSPSIGGMEFVKDDAANTIDYTWSIADFGFQAAVTYNVEIALTDSFEGSANLITTKQLTGSSLVGDINALLLAWELPINETATIKCRVNATVSEGLDPIYSAISDFTVTPYETLIDYPMVYVPGAYQGWSPGAENGRLYSYNFNTVYESTIRIVDAENPTSDVGFKITSAPDWNGTNWGGSLTKTGDDYSGTIDPSGGDFFVSPGTYMLSVNTEALTIDLTKTDDWSIIGSATPNDWNDPDTNMEYNGQRQLWEITTDLIAGELKFRANDNWDLNYGDTDADATLDGGGDNIQIEAAGNYTIRLDLENNTYKITQN